MSDIERRDGPEPPEKPEREQIPNYEIDLTGVVEQAHSLIDVIQDAIVEAGADGEVPEWGARVMARYLANQLPEPSSALHHFAVTGRSEYEPIGRELAGLWEAADRDDLTTEVINRLGTYLIDADRIERATAKATYSEEFRAVIASLGAPFVAFLSLPDVTAENAQELFHESFYGSYGSLEEIALHVGETHEVWRLLEDASLSHLAGPDRGLLLKLARERWDIVQQDDRYYLFEK